MFYHRPGGAFKRWILSVCLACACFGFAPASLRGEVILQYFNLSWNQLAEKMPEIAEAGYNSLWLPPPTKASGAFSVGYDLWDPFDLGSTAQRGTVRTRYGTEDDLLNLVRTAHRFGIRVYFDNIMNHRAFDVPGFNENTPIDIYPGMVPEDFHLRVTEEGFYRKWDNTRDWGDVWQVQNLGLADLIDIAHETPNANFGPTEGSTHPKITFLRHPQNPEYYCYIPGDSGTSHAAYDGIYVGFGPDNGITEEFLAQHAWFYEEDVNAMLIRAVRWKMDRTRADGLRLDAVKHVPSWFFGQQHGFGRDASQAGYVGGIQRQFNLSRGFSDWDNLRDSVFNSEIPRDDALVFGEHLGAPPGYQEYIDAGMRLLDAPLHREMNNRLGNPSSGLNGLDTPGWSGDPAFNDATGISFAQSHDDDFANRRGLQHAYYLTRRGIANIYTDGYYKAETLGESGGAFPRHANNPFLGQFGDNRLPNLLAINENFARGQQIPRWSDADVVAYERRDKRENQSMSDADGTVLLFMMNDNFADGQARPISTSFPAVSGGANAYLHNYSTHGGGFYVWASDIEAGNVIIPPGGYFAFSWKNPDPSRLWNNAGGDSITILQGGEPVDSVRVTRRDGPDGDPQFNPLNLPNRGYAMDEIPEPFSYKMTLPRVTDGSNLSFIVRADGSAENILLKLNGGIDINSHLGLGAQEGDLRDNPPALSTDTFLGYEQMQFVHRQHPERFAAALSERNQIGSAGAETYHTTVGSGTITRMDGPEDANDFNTFGGNVAAFVWHDPEGQVGGAESVPAAGEPQYDESGSDLTIWAKTNSVGEGFRMFLYYTTDGSDPEGAGGAGIGNTGTAELFFQHNDDGGATDWWGSATIPRPDNGTELRYKIGIFRDTAGGQPVASVFPDGPGSVAYKGDMMSVFEITGLDAGNIPYYIHNDYAATATGLQEGFHVLRARPMLDRTGRASIFNTFTQVFYYDAERPFGEIAFPANDGDTIGGQEYELVVRTDRTVTEVWYHIADSSASNNDSVTGVLNGIGDGFEPYTDLNGNGQWDPGEPFEDINGNGVWDDNIGDSWVRARRVTATPAVPSDYPVEWRFSYSRIPSSGDATIRVRLRELSSLPRNEWLPGTSDQDGHFTTLVRNVNTAGPDIRTLVGWPRQDGDTVGPGYTMKVYFSKALAEGLSESQLIDLFTLRLQSTESGNTTGGIAQSREDYAIVWNETAEFHALAFDLPNLFNGDPGWLHGIEAVFNHPDAGSLRATRLVRALPVPPPPRVDIINPLEIDSDGRPVEIILPQRVSPAPGERDFPVRVKTDADIDSLEVTFDFHPETFDGALGLRPPTVDDPNPVTDGNSSFHDFIWSDLVEGNYRMTATVTRGTETNTVRRNARVVFRQFVNADGSGDSDDDGIPDSIEGERVPLPEGNPETWSNGDVHIWFLSGRTDPLRPQSDGSLLPDGLQLGLINPLDPAATDITEDTSGDGFTNFLSDLDPPIFNTTDNSAHPRYNLQLPRTDLIGGSVTDPRRADTDDDGLMDHLEDLNRNGRVDIGLLGEHGKVVAILTHPNIPTLYNTSRVDREALPTHAIFLETDPNNPDTIGDGLLDGQGDINANGRVDIFLLHENGTLESVDYTDRSSPFFQYNRLPDDDTVVYWDNHNPPAWHDGSRIYPPIISRAVDYASLLADYASNGTGSLQDQDGWPRILITETDPLRLDTIGDGLPDGWKVRHGLDPLDDGVYNWRTGEPGNPENGPMGDLTGDGITNAQHFNAGTDPRTTLSPGTPGEQSITLGPGEAIGVINGQTYFREFADWTFDDLIALDEYEGDGNNNQGGDLYPAFDGFDSSRDIIAFYARDGGDPEAGGDGRVYFRLDFDNLRAFAELGFLNIYVAINQNPGVGERVLPDQVDTLTDMRWRAVVAVYNSTEGRVFVDTDPQNNTQNFGDDLFAGKGVVIYDQNHPHGFQGAYFNNELDAVEFAISRQALLDGGWLGADFNQLNFQVYTTKDGTGNNPPGPGDIPGRSDLRDTITDDRVVENNFFAQAGREDILRNWISAHNRPAANQRAKVMLLTEGNQHIMPGHEIQDRINDGAGAGYHRLLRAHELFAAPLTLAITPTLASAIQWAAVDPAAGKPWRDGPSFNLGLRQLRDNGLLFLTGTSFAGHAHTHTTLDFDSANIRLAESVLAGIYGEGPSTEVIYIAERLIGPDVLDRIRDLGYSHTFIDQREHMETWFGRTQALGTNGFRPNRVNQVNTLVLHDDISRFRFDNLDGGAPLQLRGLLSRKSRSSQQQQVTIIISSLEDFTDAAQADAYQRNLRWLINRPWIEIVTPQDIIEEEWQPVERGNRSDLPTVAKNFIQYASQGTFENWYSGNSEREGLAAKIFERRSGVPLPQPFGQIGVNGLADSVWTQIQPLSADSSPARLAHAVAGASLFTTAFHNQSTVDLRKFSTGEYIQPAAGFESLADFSATAQAQFRMAGIYARVNQWALNDADLPHAVAIAEDLTFDGVANPLLYNSRIFAVFDRMGGRMLASWVRDPLTGRVFQASGNLLAMADGPTAEEGTVNGLARRTSGFSDWFAAGPDTHAYVNDEYVPSLATTATGWKFTSSDGGIEKTITLDDNGDRLLAHYQLDPAITGLAIRFGLSPDFEQLLISGQNHLSAPADSGTRVKVATQGQANHVAVSLHYGSPHNASWNSAATDDPQGIHDTVAMRNQAHTQQIEISGSGSFTFALAYAAEPDSSLDSDGDGLPDWWEELHFGGPTAAHPHDDPDRDGLTNLQEYILGTNPNMPAVYSAEVLDAVTGFAVRFHTIQNRYYRVYYSEDLNAWLPASGAIPGTGGIVTWIDDGSETPIHPDQAVRRFYRVQVSLPVE